MYADPISVILVKGDSKGDRLLFRYPYTVNKRAENGEKLRRKNPYALVVQEDLMLEAKHPSSLYCISEDGQLTGFTDEVLSNLFAVKQELAETKFELKANNVRFVGHPTLVHPCKRQDLEENRSIILINIVFALKSSASHSIVKCYYELSKRLGVALRHEEKRCAYVTNEVKTMIAIHDDFAAREECSTVDNQSPFKVVLEKCSLGRDLRKVYDDLRTSGLVHLRVNRWIELSFCLPQKVHQLYNKSLLIDPETIDRCLQNLRPYHGLLLLVDSGVLVESLVPDASPALIRLIKIYTPLKSLQLLSADADLTLTQVFNLAGHLLYWGKAIIIYPLCESNIYMTSPNAAVHLNSQLVDKFAERFPNHSLIQVMSEFSLPISIRQKMSPLSSDYQTEVHIVIWLLQHRLLIQLHTYIYYMPTNKGLCLQESRSDEAGYGGSSPSESSLSLSDEGSWTVGGGLGGEEWLSQLSEEQRSVLLHTPTAATRDDLTLLVRLILQDYLQGEHHLEEIMYLENVRRSQLLQLIDKFRDVLITCEAEDPAIATFYPHSY